MWKDVFMLKVLKGFPICEAQSDDARWAFTLFLGGASIMHPGVTIAIGAKRHLPGALGWHGWEQSAELVVIYHWYLSAEMNESWPIGSMYGIYAKIGGILMVYVNVTIYSIHGSYAIWFPFGFVWDFIYLLGKCPMNPGDPVLLFALVPSDGARTSHLPIPDLPVMFQFGGSHSRFSDKPKSRLIYPTMFFCKKEIASP